MLYPMSLSRRFSIAVLTALTLTACGKGQAPQEPVRAVKVLTVGESGSALELEFSGEVRARVESNLGFRVAGKLLSRPAEIGQRVKAGELLAQIDPQDYRVTADAAAAQLVAAQTNRDVAVQTSSVTKTCMHKASSVRLSCSAVRRPTSRPKPNGNKPKRKALCRATSRVTRVCWQMAQAS